MLKHYALVAVRALRRRPTYGIVNVLGLGVGMACCVLLFLYVRDELRYDRFHENADRVVRVVRERQRGPNDWGRLAITPWRLAPMLKETLPQVEKTVRISPQEMLVRPEVTGTESASYLEPGFFLADPSFFDVFTFPLVRGDPGTALTEPFSVILTESTAARYFGDADPVGRVLRVDDEFDFTVTGIAADVPENSHFHFDLLASMSSAEVMWAGNTEMFESMGAVWLYTYLLLEPGAEIATLEAQIEAFIAANLPVPPGSFRIPLQRLTDIHLHSDYDGELEANGDIQRIYLLSLLAAFILLLACVNFMNLATARAAQRAREVGVRKAVGAHRRQLVGQFLGEAVLLSALALALALGLIALGLPAFNAFTGKALSLFAEPAVPAVLVGLTVLVGLIAGSYPAFYLSRFRPARVLKGETQSGGRGEAWLRQGLVAFQFAITIGLLIGTGAVFQQLRYVQQKELGFEDDHLVVLQLNHDRARSDYEILKATLEQTPNVTQVATASNVPTEGLNTWDIRWDGMPTDLDLSIPLMSVDYAYVETLGLELAAGRTFSPERATDAPSGFLLNQTAVETYGFDQPVGQEVEFWVGDQLVKAGEVIGVVEDFHMGSLHEAIRPLMMTIRPSWYSKLLVRVRSDAVPEALAAIEDEWNAFAPDWPFEYAFLDQRVARLYEADQRLGRIFALFAGLAILIACLGLFGLATFVTTRRTKEIGVRKVLGASVGDVVTLLARDFARPVVLALVVAAPLAYFATSRWLESFAYHTELAWWIYPAAGALALAIALATVSVHTLRAATVDPVASLRHE